MKDMSPIFSTDEKCIWQMAGVPDLTPLQTRLLLMQVASSQSYSPSGHSSVYQSIINNKNNKIFIGDHFFAVVKSGSTLPLPFLVANIGNSSPCHTLQKNYYLCIFRKGTARPQSQFPHSCVCERFMYSHDHSTYFPAAEYADWSWKYIYRTQKQVQ